MSVDAQDDQVQVAPERLLESSTEKSHEVAENNTNQTDQEILKVYNWFKNELRALSVSLCVGQVVCVISLMVSNTRHKDQLGDLIHFAREEVIRELRNEKFEAEEDAKGPLIVCENPKRYIFRYRVINNVLVPERAEFLPDFIHEWAGKMGWSRNDYDVFVYREHFVDSYRKYPISYILIRKD